MKKVSVVVPIFNAGNKLEKCITSILNQTFKDFELILVNDGSTDNSFNICKRYQSKDSRIILINKKNEGSIPTRRKGVEVSNSSYVMFVDADDWIDPHTIEILYKETIENKVDITVCNTYKVLGKGKIIKKKNKSMYFEKDKIYSMNQIRNELIVAYFHGHPFPSYLVAKLYKRDLLISSGKYLDRIHFLGEDLFYNLEILLKANKVKVINKTLYYYRVGGFTSNYMPYLFNDMVNGYQIQKEVIDKYYINSKQKQYNGISIMLLNTFKTCLYNLFNGKINKDEINKFIKFYVENDEVRECLRNEGSRKFFSQEYLNAIKYRDIEYLYELGEQMYNKNKPRKILINMLSKLSFI